MYSRCSVFRLFIQYFVEATLAAFTALSLLGYDATRFALLYLGSFFSADPLKLCSIGFMSGLLLGHPRTFRDLSRSHSWIVLPMCLWSLYLWKVNLLGDLQCCRNVLVPFPRSVLRHNPVSELYGQLLRPYGLVFALTCTVNCGTLYRQVPFQIMSNQFNLTQVDSNQVVETSQGWSMETGCNRAQFRDS